MYVCINCLSCLYSLFQHFIYMKSKLKTSVPNVRLQAVILCFQIFKYNLETYNKSCNVPCIGLLQMNAFFITASSATVIYCHIRLTSEVPHRTNSYKHQVIYKVIKTKQNLTTYETYNRTIRDRRRYGRG
jgi:hypothetical protein